LDYPAAILAAGDTVFVSHQHAENITMSAFNATNTATMPSTAGLRFICVNDGAAPPTALANTATCTATGEFTYLFNAGGGSAYCYGITFISGVGATGTLNPTYGCPIFERCSFQIASSGAGSAMTMYGIYKDCTIKFANAGQTLALNAGPCIFQNLSFASGSVSPTVLTKLPTYPVTFENCDFSSANAAISLGSQASAASSMYYSRCKLPASWAGNLGSIISMGFIQLDACDNGNFPYLLRRKMAVGDLYSETTVVRTGGATNGVQALSHKLVTGAASYFPSGHIATPALVKWNDVVVGNLTATVEFVHDSLTALKDNEIWMEVQYFSETGSPLGARVTTAPTFVATAADTPSSTSAWTTTGLTNPNTRKLVATIAPRQRGYVQVQVFLSKTSTTAYVDPKVTLAAA
jgi:hypothetical protein